MLRNSVKKTLAIAGLALAAAFAPMPARLIDAVYSDRLYRWLQPPLTSFSNLVPFAWFDALLLLVIAAWLAALVRDVRRRGARGAAGAALRRLVTWTSAVYLAFLLLWGLNYRRVPLQRTLAFDRSTITRDAALRAARLTVERLNALADAAHRVGWEDAGTIDPALRDGLARAAHDLGLAVPLVARPKRTLLDLYFRRAGVQGMTDPFLLETLVVGDLLPFERPLVVAHEWSHLAGLGDEAAANFAGWLACLHGSVPDQYSGWLFLYEELAAALTRVDRDAVAGVLGETPRHDLAAARARMIRNVQPAVSAAAWRAYDSYLKSNRVEAGTRSYGEVVELVLGTRFDADWTPRRR